LCNSCKNSCHSCQNNHSLKIAVNTRFLLKDKLEGIGLYTLEVVKRLAAAHPEDEFFFFFDRPFDPSFVFSKNITPVVLSPPARHPLLFIAWFEWSVSRALKKYKVDVFLSPDNFLSLSTPTPTVLIVHDIAFTHFSENDKWINRQYYKFFTPRFLKRANTILAVSEFTKQDILSNFSFVEKNKIKVAYNGCREIFGPLPERIGISSLNSILEKNKHNEAAFFLFVGAVHPRKNVHRLIEAFDLFKNRTKSDVQLVLCGRFAWQTGAVKSAYDAAIFKQDIIFKGYVKDKEVVKLTASALAVTYISLFEGFGVPLLEAMNCDTPIITSNVSSMPEVVGDAAILVNPESIEDIAEAMQQVFENENLREKLIVQGRIQRAKFDWDKTADIVYRALKNICK
jgi:glycosyltransferase involved in cell wall biosynthesis